MHLSYHCFYLHGTHRTHSYHTTFHISMSLSLRYVDDTFYIFNKSHISDFHTHLISICSQIQFTEEKEYNFSLLFLNLEKCNIRNDTIISQVVTTSDGIQGVRTGSREPVLAMPGYSANPFLLFVIDLLIHAAILSEPVLTFCYSSYNLFETVANPRRIERIEKGSGEQLSLSFMFLVLDLFIFCFPFFFSLRLFYFLLPFLSLTYIDFCFDCYFCYVFDRCFFVILRL